MYLRVLLQTGLFGIRYLWVIVMVDIIADGYGYGRNAPIVLAVCLTLATGLKLHKTTWMLVRDNYRRHDGSVRDVK